MGKTSKLAALVIGASLMLGAFGVSACTPTDEKTGNVDSDIYAIYKAYAETEGENALSYDQWYAKLLDTAKGDNGKSAYELWLEQEGNAGKSIEDFFAFLKGEDGGKGDNGKSAYELWLEQEGNAGKSIEDFFASLKGEDGARGNKIFHGEGAPDSAEGAIEGDMYLDTTKGDAYFFKDDSWHKIGEESGPQEEVVKTIDNMTFTNTEQEIDLSDITFQSNEFLYVIVTPTAAAESGKLFILANPDTGTAKFDMYSITNNDYRGFVIKNNTSIKIKTNSSSTTISGSVKIVKWSVPTIKADETYEVPANKTEHQFQVALIDPELLGKQVNIEIKQQNISNGASAGASVYWFNLNNSKELLGETTHSSADGAVCKLQNVTIPATAKALSFKVSSLNGANISVKITLA